MTLWRPSAPKTKEKVTLYFNVNIPMKHLTDVLK